MFCARTLKKDVNDVWKILRTRGGVQLIVFFGAIREILKKEIYGCDKERRSAIEIKGSVWGCGDEWGGNVNVQYLIYECMSLEFSVGDGDAEGAVDIDGRGRLVTSGEFAISRL